MDKISGFYFPKAPGCEFLASSSFGWGPDGLEGWSAKTPVRGQASTGEKPPFGGDLSPEFLVPLC